MDGGSAAGSSPCCTGTEGGAPTRLAEMMQHNEQFIARDFHKLPAFPRRVVIVTCMDPRLNTLLPKALGLKEGEAYVVKNAGAIITHPFGGITRSVFVAVYELGAKEIFIIGHRCVCPIPQHRACQGMPAQRTLDCRHSHTPAPNCTRTHTPAGTAA